ncbi:hypothetical protein ElyMa_002211500 [Elysia marginata]|uniref:Uncharacterized protein n=1 Tax=Elysia marginata TaxID=1093978 RepID=A0AAV4FUK3_9GAST|nr:hypothetical protein ElyMa_002211500 [Elysia marginata]
MCFRHSQNDYIHLKPYNEEGRIRRVLGRTKSKMEEMLRDKQNAVQVVVVVAVVVVIVVVVVVVVIVVVVVVVAVVVVVTVVTSGI